MPLCTLEIPRYSTLKDKGAQLCESALTQLSRTLEIPDPGDRETRVVDTDIRVPKMRISFTVGPNEYPAYAPKNSFSPSEDQIQTAGTIIQSKARGRGVTETTIEAWENTTFHVRDPNAPPPSPYQPNKEIGRQISQPKLILVLSPDKASKMVSSSRKETEPLKENGPYIGLAKETARRILEALGIPGNTECQTEVVKAKVADCDFSVEFDCQPAPGVKVSQEDRINAALQVEQLLNHSGLTQEGSAEIWIRQGDPKRQTFS